ncbi:MAG: hypothetical protein M1831_004369 [Alyxoria varia]|nr:MAG: hypothetical protein M1831_004369 [Alyxoria varia]
MDKPPPRAITPRPQPIKPAPLPASNDTNAHSGRWMQGLPLVALVHSHSLTQLVVKVLYNLGDEGKNNCLARLPNLVQVRTAWLNEKEIGIIELRTCIQAITDASPELTSKLGPDYTVYAYDYEEYDEPLVGQGMLSRVLASSSTTPAAPAYESLTMVTGRVTQAKSGLLTSNRGKETLDVKLRLVPVPTSCQNEYEASIEKYRDASNLGQGFDSAAWNNFVQQNSTFHGSANQSQNVQPTPYQGHQAEQNAQPAHNPYGSFRTKPLTALPPNASNFQPSQPASAAALPSPRPSSRPGTPPPRRGRPPKSQQTSRNSSTRANGTTASKRRQSQSAPGQEPSASIQGPSKKRAKVQKSDWQGPSSLETGSESLRVAASTAASIRGHLPPASNPNVSQLASSEIPARPPTPQAPRQKPLLNRMSTSVGHEVMTQSRRFYQNSSTLDSDQPDEAASSVASPEFTAGSGDSSPIDIPSSPPLGGFAFSPGIPDLPTDVDDAQLNETNMTENEEGTGAASPTEPITSNIPQLATRKTDVVSELSITEEVPGDPSLLPQRTFVRPPKPRRPPLGSKDPSQLSRRNSTTANATTEQSPECAPAVPNPATSTSEVSHETNESAAFEYTTELDGAVNPTEIDRARKPDAPESTADDQIAESRSIKLTNDFHETATTQQSHSEPLQHSARNSPDPATGTALANKCNFVQQAHMNNEPTGNKKSGGSGKRRARAVEERLRQDIQAGIMPPYCHHCGDIQTPTWRKCFTKTEQGAPETWELSNEIDGVWALEVVSRNDDGVVTAHKIFKKQIATQDEGYTEMPLCNRGSSHLEHTSYDDLLTLILACGIYLFKNRRSRPPENWNSNKKFNINKAAPKDWPAVICAEKGGSKSPNEPMRSSKLGPQESRLSTKSGEANQQDSAHSTATGGRSSQPPSGRSDKSQSKSLGPDGLDGSLEDQHIVMSEDDTAKALQKAFQASPFKVYGTQRSPIELDGCTTPDPTRRVLFPSPRRPGEVKSLVPSWEAQLSSGNSKQATLTDPFNGDSGKENSTPNGSPVIAAESARAFERTAGEKQTLTPKKSRKDSGDALKTPTHRSASKARTPRSTRSSSAKRREHATPSRAAFQSGQLDVESPFTAQLNQLFSEAPPLSPSRQSDNPFPMANSDAGLFDYSDLGEGGTAAGDLNWGAFDLTQPDGLFTLNEEPNDLNSDFMNEPLLENELDQLLKEAGEDAYHPPMPTVSGPDENGDFTFASPEDYYEITGCHFKELDPADRWDPRDTVQSIGDGGGREDGGGSGDDDAATAAYDDAGAVHGGDNDVAAKDDGEAMDVGGEDTAQN